MLLNTSYKLILIIVLFLCSTILAAQSPNFGSFEGSYWDYGSSNVVLSPTEKFIAHVDSKIKILRVWDAKTGNLILRLDESDEIESNYSILGLEWSSDDIVILKLGDKVRVVSISDKQEFDLDLVGEQHQFSGGMMYYTTKNSEEFSINAYNLRTKETQIVKTYKESRSSRFLVLKKSVFVTIADKEKSLQLYRYGEREPYAIIPSKKYSAGKFYDVNFSITDLGNTLTMKDNTYVIANNGQVIKKNDPDGAIWDAKKAPELYTIKKQRWAGNLKSERNHYCDINIIEVINKRTNSSVFLLADLSQDIISLKKTVDAMYKRTKKSTHKEILDDIDKHQKQYEANSPEGKAVKLAESGKIEEAYIALEEIANGTLPVEYSLLVNKLFLTQPERWSKILASKPFVTGYEEFVKNKRGTSSTYVALSKMSFANSNMNSNDAFYWLQKQKEELYKPDEDGQKSSLSNLWEKDPRFKKFIKEELYTEYDHLVFAGKFEDAIRLNPHLPQAYLKKVFALEDESRIAEANETVEKLLEVDPNCPFIGAYLRRQSANKNRAQAENLMKDGKWEEAKEQWNVVIRELSFDLMAKSQQIICLYKLGNESEARKAILAFGKNPRVLDDRLECYDLYEVQYEYYSKSSDSNLKQRAMWALGHIAATARNHGKKEKAYQYYVKAANYAQNEVPDYSNAMWYCKQVLELHPDKTEWENAFGKAAVMYATEQTREDEKIRYLRDAFHAFARDKNSPTSDDSRAQLAQVEMVLKSLER